MLNKKRQRQLLFWSVEILVLSTLVLISTKVGFIFRPIGTFFSTLFIPVLIAGFLFYVLNPIVGLLTKRFKLNRLLSISIVFLLLVLVLLFIFLKVIPSLLTQLTQLAVNIPTFLDQIQTWSYQLADSKWLKDINLMDQIDKFNISYGSLLQRVLTSLSSSLGSIVGAVANAAIIIITVPFILFYMLKDGNQLAPNITRFFSPKNASRVSELLGQLNKTLSSYISGQAIECLFVATCTFIGYWLVGVDYAFLFGVIAGLANLIPYLGPYIGLIPAVFVTVFNDPFKTLLCCLVVLIVQQVDGNIIYPNVIGKSLKIHPLTIILVLLVAGNIAGLLGIFLSVPFYAISRTILLFFYNLYKEAKAENDLEKESVSASSDKSSIE